MAVDPTQHDLERFCAEAPEEPVVMLNLLRFAPGGREKYAEYLRRAGEVSTELGIRVLHYGAAGPPLAGPDGPAWDAVLLVSYPSRRAFSQLVADPRYRAAARLRHEALAETLLQPTTRARL